jgi:hypothetical protein
MKADNAGRYDLLTPITPHRRHPFYDFKIFESDRHKRADGSPCIFLAGWPKNELKYEVIAELRPPKRPDAIYSFTYDRRLMHIIPTDNDKNPNGYNLGDVRIVKNERYPIPMKPVIKIKNLLAQKTIDTSCSKPLKPEIKIKPTDDEPHWSFYPKH